MVRKLKELFARHIGTLIFTVVEVVGLVVWLTLAGAGRTIGAYGAARAYVAAAVLDVFLIVEHLLAYNVIKSRPVLTLNGLPLGRTVVFSTIEAVIWAVSLVVAGYNLLAGGVVLAALLVLEHTISDNVAKGLPLFSRLVDKTVVPLSIVEAAAATIWFYFVGAGKPVIGVAVLAVGSFVEHTMLVKVGRQPARR